MGEVLLWTGGHAIRHLDPRYFSASHSSLHDTLERDGPITYREDEHAWRSAGGRTVSIPYAVVGDFGDLVPVSHPVYGGPGRDRFDDYPLPPPSGRAVELWGYDPLHDVPRAL